MNKTFSITKQRLLNHLHYGKWYYIASVAVMLVAVNLLYSVTAPEYPPESRVSVMMYAGDVAEDNAAMLEQEMLGILGDDQREVKVVTSIYADSTMPDVILARIIANQDDVLVLNSEYIQTLAENGAFIPLDEHMDLGKIFSMYPDIDWADYLMVCPEYEEGEHYYWLPLGVSQGLTGIVDSKDYLGIAVLRSSKNPENALLCLEYMLTR
ncbi:MAG: hypothetical protein JXN65_06830 [Clostridia bacterium]|nr:hypothetical protein [Clostridia bacterium]